MPLTLPDTLSGRSRRVRPSAGRSVRMYVCGPTVYDGAHVGHARTYLAFDVARRHLEAEGLRVRHVMNITDVEDKVEQRARTLGVSWRTLARREEASFFQDLDSFGLLRPHVHPRASDFVPEIVRLVRALDRTGRVRREGDEWIYEAPERRPGQNFPTGAGLARHAVPEPGQPFPSATGEDRAFMIWKRQGPPHPSWPGPWGRGIPGWHLECVAMADRSLGLPVDLHGGGRDLVYPHHYGENEIALATRRVRFSRLFFHAGLVFQDGAKMSKSSGNLALLRTVLASSGPGPLKWYLLDGRLTETLAWSPAALARARADFEHVREALGTWLAPGAGGRRGAGPIVQAAAGVRRAIAEGLRTDRAVERIRRLAGDLGADPAQRVARGERRRALAAVRALEARTGLELL